MPYQLSWQPVKKNWETPVQDAGSVDVTSGGALVTRSASAASAPFGSNKIPAAKIATAMPLFHITNSPPRKQSLQWLSTTAFASLSSTACARADRPGRYQHSTAKYGGIKIPSQDRVETNLSHKNLKFTDFIEYPYL